jgi:hypothetical protein
MLGVRHAPRKAAYATAGFVALMAIVAGGAVALSGSDKDSGNTAAGAPAPAAATSTPTPSPVPVVTPSKVPAVLVVPALKKLTPPDVVVTLRHAASARAVSRLKKMTGVHRVVLADRGAVKVHGVRLEALGVPLRTIRGFTPSLTAKSTPLWQSVARGELTVAYANAKGLRRHLGATFPARGPSGTTAPLRVGAFATLGLPGGQALVSLPEAGRLGLARARVALVTAPKVSLDTLRADVHATLGAQATIAVTRPLQVDQSLSSTYAQTNVPAYYLALYRRAAVTCPGLPWTVLAGIGTVETGNGRDVHKSSAGAEGPMQFEPSTWAVYGYDADGDGKANINDPVDAVFSAARYLCAAGASRGGQSLNDAIFAYNHAWWYVREVVNLANEYA